MSAVYFWREGKVETVHPRNNYTTRDATEDGKVNLPCVDTNFEGATGRYGMYVREEWAGFTKWVPKDISTFPAEFRLQLLLLGVA